MDRSKSPDATIVFRYKARPSPELRQIAVISSERLLQELNVDAVMAQAVLALFDGKKRFGLSVQASLTWKAISAAADAVLVPH
jgi:hypothetical protein